MTYIKVQSSGIKKGADSLDVPDQSMQQVYAIKSELAKHLPRGALLVSSRIYENGDVLFPVSDEHAAAVLERLPLVVTQMACLIERRTTAREANEPAPVHPGDERLLGLNEDVFNANRQDMKVFLDGERNALELVGTDPDSLIVPVPNEGEIFMIRALCTGAKVVTTPNNRQGELFPDQEVDHVFFTSHADVDQVRHTGKLAAAWLVRSFACEIEVECCRQRPGDRVVYALSEPRIISLPGWEA